MTNLTSLSRLERNIFKSARQIICYRTTLLPATACLIHRHGTYSYVFLAVLHLHPLNSFKIRASVLTQFRNNFF